MREANSERVPERAGFPYRKILTADYTDIADQRKDGEHDFFVSIREIRVIRGC
jgi:hypothetical protein